MNVIGSLNWIRFLRQTVNDQITKETDPEKRTELRDFEARLWIAQEALSAVAPDVIKFIQMSSLIPPLGRDGSPLGDPESH